MVLVEGGRGVKRGFLFKMREMVMYFYSDRNGPGEKGNIYNAGVRRERSTAQAVGMAHSC